MLQSSLYISNAVGPLVGGVLASAVGYRVTFLVTAALYVLSAIPAMILIRERFTPPTERAPFLPSMARNYRMVFRRRDLLIPVFAAFLSYSAISCLQPVLPLYIAGLVGTENAERATGLAAGLQGLAGTVAAFGVGRVTARFGFRPVLTWAPALMIGVFLALWAAERFLVLLAMLMVAGVIQGLAVTTLTALIALRAPRESAGATFGVVSSINSFAFSGAPFLAGVVASTFGLRAVFPLCAVLAAGMLALSVRAVGDGHVAVVAPATASRPRESTTP